MNKRKRIFANRMHRDLFLIILLASLLPTIIVTICLYYLIFSVTASQFAIPEVIAYNLIPAAKRVTIIILVSAPILISAIMIFAHKITHKIIGPFDRIVRELDEFIEGKKVGHIVIRQTDEFVPLVERINKLLDRLKKD